MSWPASAVGRIYTSLGQAECCWIADCLGRVRGYGLDRVLITCSSTNKGSRRIVTATGSHPGAYAKTPYARLINQLNL